MTNLVPRLGLALALALLGLSASPGRAAAPAVTQVAPGVWRLRFATPEKFTPMTFRPASAKIGALKALPSQETPPLPLDRIVFSASKKNCSVRLPLEADDHLYGFGLTPTLFEMNGHRLDVRPTDAPENPRGESHAPVPLYVSTRGYAVYVDTARFAQFYCGISAPANPDEALAQSLESWAAGPSPRSPDVTAIVPDAQGLDVYLFAGPTMRDAVQRYDLFSGGGPVPPLWGLGIWYRGSTNFTDQDSLELARAFRADQIPCDVWGVEPGWQTHAYSCSFVWDERRFPNPDRFIHDLRALGYHSNFWEHAFTHPSAPNHAELEPYAGDHEVWGGLVPDFASPKGREIFAELQKKSLFSKGVNGVKLDECDDQPLGLRWSFPSGTRFPSGLDGQQMHSLFGVLYQQTMLAPFAAANQRTWGLARNSGALAAPLPYGVYSDSYDHRGYIRGLLNGGFSGLLWVPEVRESSSAQDLYRRIETAIFAPITQINSWYLKHPPWLQFDREKNNRDQLMADRAEVTATVRQLFELRMSLVPYLYSAFNAYHRTGLPPIRPLVLDWPADARARGVDDQFMLGPSLLVAPRIAGQRRQVYLPPGIWYDFWSHQKIQGGVSVEASEETARVPIFVKADRIIPLARPVEFIAADTCFELTAHVYGAGSSEFSLYEDDGQTLNFEKGAQNVITLAWKENAGTVRKTGAYRGAPRYRIVEWTSEPLSIVK